jgi:Fe-S cluster assembly protein SufD
MSEATTTLTAVSGLSQFVAEQDDPGWLAPIRRRALERFGEYSWPSLADEEWRRTPLRGFQFDGYGLLSPSRTPLRRGEEPAESADPQGPSPSPGGVLSFDGAAVTEWWVARELSEHGVVLVPWSSVAAGTELADQLAQELSLAVEQADDRIQLWRYAIMTHGALLVVPDGVELTRPLFVNYHAAGEELLVAAQTVIMVGDGARCEIVRRLTSGHEGEVLLLDGTTGTVGASSTFTLQTVEALGEESVLFSNAALRGEADAALTTHESYLGADFVKARTECDLVGPGANANLFGLYFGAEEQHVDVRTVQRHRGHHTGSWAYYRGAVRDEAHSVYQGLIQVDGTARGTDAYLTNKNLILSDTARADSIPSLNINTDDVKCSHGSSTGKMDPTQLFYLLTRGYSEHEARRMLVEGFFEDVIMKANPTTRDDLRSRIYERIE